MSAKTKRKEPPGYALQRVCCRHLQRALDRLENIRQPETVHGVRKEIKKLRALLRLARPAVDRKAYRKTAQVMRLAAKPLAVPRDAHVTAGAMDKLIGRNGQQFPNLRAVLAAHCQQTERGFQQQGAGEVAVYLLKRARRALDKLDLHRAAWSELKAGLAKSYRRGRAARQLAVRQPTAEHLHAWRKRVKDLLYQLEFLCPDWPAQTQSLLRALAKLSEQLGDDHDLVLLEQFAQDTGTPAAEWTHLRRLISARRQKSGQSIQRLGELLYAWKPSAVCDQWEQDWQAWRQKS